MSPRYMLDTDAVSHALRGHGQVGARILEHVPSALCISAITLGELRYGVERRNSPKLRRLVERFVATIAVAPFDETCARTFGKIASKLATKGRPIGSYDTLIAAHAVALGITLVTSNDKHFSQVDGLKTVSWV